MEDKKKTIEEIKRKIPQTWDIEIEVEEYWGEEGRPFISDSLLESEEESAIEYIKEMLVDQGYDEKDVEEALNEADIEFNYYLVFPSGETRKIVWESIDALRGHYGLDVPEIFSKEAEKAVGKSEPIKISLSYVARDSEENEKYLAAAIEELEKAGFEAKPILFSTSNPFATNVELIITPKESRKFTKRDLEFLKEFSNIYVDKYTSSFSIFTGTTQPIDRYVKEFKKEIDSLRKKLEEVM
ncbi:MAG: hypothetical protein QW734_07105 [Candidatus Bathyarchaeia archaeon]